jgi:hypothetical protein
MHPNGVSAVRARASAGNHKDGDVLRDIDAECQPPKSTEQQRAPGTSVSEQLNGFGPERTAKKSRGGEDSGFRSFMSRILDVSKMPTFNDTVIADRGLKTLKANNYAIKFGHHRGDLVAPRAPKYSTGPTGDLEAETMLSTQLQEHMFFEHQEQAPRSRALTSSSLTHVPPPSSKEHERAHARALTDILARARVPWERNSDRPWPTHLDSTGA